MSTADTGGYDLVIEAASQLIFDIAAAITLPPVTCPISTSGQFALTGSLSATCRINGVGFRSPGTISLTIDLSGSSITLQAVAGFPSPVPSNLKRITLVGTMSVTGELLISDLALQASFGNEIGEVELSEILVNSLLTAPAAIMLLAYAQSVGATSSQVKGQIVAALTQSISTLVGSMGAITLINGSQMSDALHQATGQSIRHFGFLLGEMDDSIFLLFTIGGTRGTWTKLTRSNLRRDADGLPTDLLAIVLSNQCLFRDFVEPQVAAALALNSPFFPSAVSPAMAWAGNSPLTEAESKTLPNVELSSLLGGIDGTNLRILLGGRATGETGFFTVTTFTIDVAVALQPAISEGFLVIQSALAREPEITFQISFPWWLFLVVGLFTLGLGDIALGILQSDPSILDSFIQNNIAGSLPMPSFKMPLPDSFPELRVREMSLFQSDASRGVITFGASPFSFSIPFPFALNDVIINLVGAE